MTFYIPDHMTKTFNWLNAERAARIAEICKKHGATVKRVAQERGALGYCKIVARFDCGSRVKSSAAIGAARREIEAAGLTTQLTYQNS